MCVLRVSEVSCLRAMHSPTHLKLHMVDAFFGCVGFWSEEGGGAEGHVDDDRLEWGEGWLEEQ